MIRFAAHAILIPCAGDRDMKIIKGAVLVPALVSVLLLSGAVLYLSFGNIFAFLFSRAYHIDVRYKTARHLSAGAVAFTDLTLNDKASGFLVFSKFAKVRPKPKNLSFDFTGIDFNLQDVRFDASTLRLHAANPVYDTLTGLASVPFDSRWTYSVISGSVRTIENGVEIKDFTAAGKEIRISLSGTVIENTVLNLDIKIYFSKEFRQRVPEEMAKVLFSEEAGGWDSMSLHIEGDYNKPSISLSSKLFRLNIREISGV